MRLAYENAEIEIVKIAGDDLITTSGPINGGLIVNPDGSIDLPGDRFP